MSVQCQHTGVVVADSRHIVKNLDWREIVMGGWNIYWTLWVKYYSIICKMREEYYKYTSRVARLQATRDVYLWYSSSNLQIIILSEFYNHLKKIWIFVIFHLDNEIFGHPDELENIQIFIY